MRIAYVDMNEAPTRGAVAGNTSTTSATSPVGPVLVRGLLEELLIEFLLLGRHSEMNQWAFRGRWIDERSESMRGKCIDEGKMYR